MSLLDSIGFSRCVQNQFKLLPSLPPLVQMSKMYDSNSDLDRQIEQLKRCEIIQEHEVKALCAKAREILIEESNVQRVDSPVTVRMIF